MDERTLTALKGSIAKWEGILAGTAEDEGIANCPLCEEFFREECFGCPVKEFTGESGCDDTPYDTWTHHHQRSRADYKLDGKDMVALGIAKCELDFLRSLLPESEK